MDAPPVKVGIVGLGAWAKVLARAAQKSGKLTIESATSRSAEKRAAFTQEFGIATAPDLAALLANPEIKGVLITASNEQHLTLAREAAKAGKHIYVEKPIADTLANALAMDALQARHGVAIMVGHAARLLTGTRMIKAAIEAGELGRVTFMEANFSTPRALTLTPNEWRWYRDKSPGGPLSQLSNHLFDTLHYLGGEIAAVSAIASKLSPAGAEVDDQSMTLLKFADGKIAYAGASWTSPGVYSLRVFGQGGLMHYEVDQGAWASPGKLHETSTLYVQRGKDTFAKREQLRLPPGDIFREELDLFADACRSGAAGELSAKNGIVALACVEAALRSIERNGALVTLAEVIADARRSPA